MSSQPSEGVSFGGSGLARCFAQLPKHPLCPSSIHRLLKRESQKPIVQPRRWQDRPRAAGTDGADGAAEMAGGLVWSPGGPGLSTVLEPVTEGVRALSGPKRPHFRQPKRTEPVLYPHSLISFYFPTPGLVCPTSTWPTGSDYLRVSLKFERPTDPWGWGVKATFISGNPQGQCQWTEVAEMNEKGTCRKTSLSGFQSPSPHLPRSPPRPFPVSRELVLTAAGLS